MHKHKHHNERRTTRDSGNYEDYNYRNYRNERYSRDERHRNESRSYRDDYRIERYSEYHNEKYRRSYKQRSRSQERSYKEERSRKYEKRNDSEETYKYHSSYKSKYKKKPKEQSIHFQLKGVPHGWIECSEYGDVLKNTNIIPLKTPFDKSKHTVKSFINVQEKDFNRKVTKIIDLTDTTRYYSSENIPEGVEYVKIRIQGGKGGLGGTIQDIESFSKAVSSNLDKGGFTAVHCTVKKKIEILTGFLCCHFLLSMNKEMKVEEAIEIFNSARKPGFHKQRYIDRLYELFNQTDSENYKKYETYPAYPKWSKDYGEYSSVVVKSTTNVFSNSTIQSEKDQNLETLSNKILKKLVSQEIVGNDEPLKLETVNDEMVKETKKSKQKPKILEETVFV
eukprot:gene9041-1138_t